MMTERRSVRKCKGRERLIGAAQELAQTSAFDEITIDEIVKAADLSRPAFYYHFAGGKEELRAELIHNGSINAPPEYDTRQAILHGALRVFARAGVASATLEDIAAEAGVSRGTLSWHFHSKNDLLVALVDTVEHQRVHVVLRATIELIEREMAGDGACDDEKVLRSVANGFYDFFTAQRDFVRLSVVLAHTHPELAHVIAEKITRGRKGINDYIKARQEEGSFRQDIDPALFVQVLAMTFVMRAIAGELNDLLPFAYLSREEIIDQLVSLLLHGIKKSSSTGG